MLLEVAGQRSQISSEPRPFPRCFRGQVVLHHEDGQVAHHLEEGVTLTMSPSISLTFSCISRLPKRLPQVQALHLRLQVGILTARNLVTIDIGDRRLQVPDSEVHIAFPDVCPVIGQLRRSIRLRPVSRSCPSRAATTVAFRGPAGQSSWRRWQRSAMSRRLRLPSGVVATWLPVVSWVCRWMGISRASFRPETKTFAE